ncbi:hypothetical protein C0J52_22651 [Blattella germanica]|nr:hypothetical protein C0J52_22651 [Blattella germanica]
MTYPSESYTINKREGMSVLKESMNSFYGNNTNMDNYFYRKEDLLEESNSKFLYSDIRRMSVNNTNNAINHPSAAFTSERHIKEGCCGITDVSHDVTDTDNDSATDLAVVPNQSNHYSSTRINKEFTLPCVSVNTTSQNSEVEGANIPTSNTPDNNLIPTSSSSSSSPTSVASNRRIWNFGRKKADIICDTVDAWSNSRSGRLFLNLKQSLFGHMNRTERMMLIGGSKPLVFGGTYPIDVPLDNNPEDTLKNRKEKISPQTFDIDAPYLDSHLEQMLARAASDCGFVVNAPNILKRNNAESQSYLSSWSLPESKYNVPKS